MTLSQRDAWLTPPPPGVVEKEFQRRWVVPLAEARGWRRSKADQAEAEHYAGLARDPALAALPGLVFHNLHPMGSEPGWPDLTLVRRSDRRLVFAELKSEAGKPTPRQLVVLELLRSLENEHEERRPGEPRVGVYVWRPSDWERIQEVLR